MKKRVLYILAPNDRFNYGDLIFPYIINHYIGKDFDEIKYVSTSKSDLSELGGIPTESYEALYSIDNKNNNYLIVAGGESLFAKWGAIMAFVDSKYYNVQSFLKKIFFIKKSIGQRVYNLYAMLTLPVKTKYPFTIGKNELPYFKGVFYNSIGGAGLDSIYGAKLLQREKEKDILNSVDYISVRDKYTSNALAKASVKNSIVADCAIMMSDVFTDDLLESRLTLDKTLYKESYIFFQGNKLYLNKDAQKIAIELSQIQSKTGLKICLCPIGTALGHEDVEGLEVLAKFLESYGLIYTIFKKPNLFDIMWLIKSSKLYIGSSLHGIITAMSFNIPYIGYCKNKLMTYIETWGDSNNFAESPELIYKKAARALNTPIDIDKLHMQKETVSKSFECISRCVNNL